MKANFELVESLRQRRREIEINAYGYELIITTGPVPNLEGYAIRSMRNASRS
ncbi:hypothetical protein [Sphaerochaeta sp. S2]|jgi:hypothetical protein|uniref:hypothetical protein n=1 Tax=Sphaerochaeta sp. S2 TaxID=2798868 RepID=UPI0018E9B044|nr:hypothetical protein [Sphaerochaeta sp. S2]MBJ2357735.1 hypothetical protein [Sphaerochaeta sp. S2]